MENWGICACEINPIYIFLAQSQKKRVNVIYSEPLVELDVMLLDVFQLLGEATNQCQAKLRIKH